MAKYQVRIIETAAYVIAVEASSQEEADVLANQKFTDSTNINEFFDNVQERVTDLVLEVNDAGLPV